MPPKMSVLMSVYNGARYLRIAVDSVLGQTFEDFEFIIVDDGSTDDSIEILSAYDDPRIRLISNEENIGLTRSLNIGLEIARGDYVARMDPDDICVPERFERQVEYLDSSRKVGVIGSQMTVINEVGTPLRTFEVPTSHSMIVWTLFFKRAFGHPSVMMRKSIVESVGGYDESYRYAQDYGLWIRLLGVTQFASMPEVLVLYRTHPGTISNHRTEIQQGLAHRARQQLISQVLDRAISTEIIGWLFESQRPSHTLSDHQTEQVIATLLALFSASERNAYLIPAELDEERQDMVEKIIAASRSSLLSPSHLARTIWYSLFPEFLRRALNYPKSILSKIL